METTIAADVGGRARNEMRIRHGSIVGWRHPYGSREDFGRVVRITDQFIDVTDRGFTEGIQREWIVQVDGKPATFVGGRLIATCRTCGEPHDHVHACAVCGQAEMDDGKPFIPCCEVVR
jgi:hypothetical protein